MAEELLPSLPQQSASPPSPPATLPPTTSHEPLDFPDPIEYVREQLCIPLGLPVNLWSVPDDGLRPATALHLLVRLAICGSEKRMLTLQGIYEALQERFAFFRSTNGHDTVAWQGSVRHAMSLYRIFVNRERDMGDKGRGSYWTIDIRNGEGYTRDRKRAATGIQKQTARIKMSR
ncbi:hypothetical protein GGX14DRAFT_355342 [Mycena pura]|uniref:Fork-head domain-containing protein n=1 Tax=Mycena pura TaxID=153505 RepID=A0AAD6VQU0_9AGAR|nr:hypothetical protein GGX14DRAFT_355342 [Mycena pura]